MPAKTKHKHKHGSAPADLPSLIDVDANDGELAAPAAKKQKHKHLACGRCGKSKEELWGKRQREREREIMRERESC